MNLDIYNKVRTVPPEALKTISGGRMNGKSDINPMWRIKTLTEQFGVCGIGWKYEIVNMWLEKGGKDEVSAFTQINLYIKDGDKWSDAIPGIGGSSFVALESKGLFTSDECYKMSLTDAISVSCKALGVAADVYFDKDKSKYDKPEQPNSQSDVPKTITADQFKILVSNANNAGWNLDKLLANVQKNFKVEKIEEMTQPQFTKLMSILDAKIKKLCEGKNAV